MTQLLKRAGGNVSQAAREGGLDRVYLHRLIKKHGIASTTTQRTRGTRTIVANFCMAGDV